MANKNPNPKFSTREVVGVSIPLVTADLINIALFFFGLDDFTILDWLVDVPMGVYYYHKGVLGTEAIAQRAIPWIIGQIAAKVFPYFDVVPLYAPTFWLIVWFDRHPKIGAIAEKVGSVETGGKGAAGAARTEGAAASEAGTAARAGNEAVQEGGEAAANLGGESAVEQETRAEGEGLSEGERAGGARTSEQGDGESGGGEQGVGGGPEEETRRPEEEQAGAEGGEEDQGPELSPEEQDLADIASGNWIGRMAREYGAKGIFAQFGQPINDNQPRRRNARPDSRNATGRRTVSQRTGQNRANKYNDSERVDLSKNRNAA